MSRILAEEGQTKMINSSGRYFQYNCRMLPEIRLADTAAIEPPYLHKRRMPGEYILYLIRRGEMYLSENETLYHLLPGDFLLLEPDRTHVGRKAASCEYYYVHFQYESLKAVRMTDEELGEKLKRQREKTLRMDSQSKSVERQEILFLPKYLHLASDAGYRGITQLLNDGIAFHNSPMEGGEALCASRILEVLIRVSRQFLSVGLGETDGSGRGSRKVWELLDYLNMFYYEPISGDSLEQKFDCNFDYMNRLFRQSIGKPVFQYLSEIRIAHAKELLATSSMKVSQISEKVGFSDESYFSKVFKRHTGSSPSNYAKTCMDS